MIERATAALTDLEETATSRSLRSKALLKRAHQAECDGHFNEARDLYNTAAELDARNTAAAEGKHRMMWLLGEPPFDGPELIINPGRFEARFAFNEAVEQADLALAQRPPRIDAAWVHFERARAVVVQSAEVVTPETIRGWNKALRELALRLTEADTQSERPASPRPTLSPDPTR